MEYERRTTAFSRRQSQTLTGAKVIDMTTCRAENWFDVPLRGRKALSSAAASPGASRHVGPWFMSHFKRQDFTLPIALSLAEATLRLESVDGVFSVGLSEGLVGLHRRAETLVTLSANRSPNPWRFTLKGALSTDETDTWLRASVGPSSATQVRTALWLSLVTLFLASGLVSMGASLASGRGAANLSLVLGSAVIIVVSFVIIDISTKRARRRWNQIEDHLRRLLAAVDVV